MAINILALSAGGTSTKIGYFRDDQMVFKKTIEHSKEELGNCKSPNDQLDMRFKSVRQLLEKENVDLGEISAAVGRGGFLPPIDAGAYEVNNEMIDYILSHASLGHVSSLSAVLADRIAKMGCPNAKAFIYDGETLDQLIPIARFSGLKGCDRISIGHLLNSRAVARIVSEKIGANYEKLNFIVAHMGGGTSVTAHEQGFIVDLVADDEGPFSVERTGSLPMKHVIKLCYDYPKADVMKMLRVDGGLKSYLGTNDGRVIEERIRAGDREAELVFEALAYQVAKAVGDMSVAVNGEINAIVLTGGLANSGRIVGWITKRVNFIAPVHAVPGEFELEALAKGVWRVLSGLEDAHAFTL